MAGSLRRRLLVGTGLGIASTFLVVGMLVYRLQRTSLYEQFDSGLADRAHALAMLVEQEPSRIETDLSRIPLAEFSRLDRPQYFTLWRADGHVVDRSRSLRGAELVLPPGDDATTITAVRLPDGAAGRQATLRFTPRQDPDGTPAEMGPPLRLVLGLAQDTGDVEASLARLRSVLAISMVVATLLGLAILWWVGRYGLRPVDQLATQISELDPLAPRGRFASPTLPVELQPIGQRLDELVQKLQTAFARERELTSELAHELRTPISGLRVTLELALSREREGSVYREAMTECLVICDQTQRMVDSLLALARLDANLVPLARSPVTLPALVADALPGFERRADARSVTVEVALADAPPIDSDQDQLTLLINNLLDNAVSHVDDHGTIRVTAGGSSLRVANTGCALTPEQVQQATSRFWRGDLSRVAGGHTGLGLALCQKVVSLLGGTLVVSVEPGGWFVATVELS